MLSKEKIRKYLNAPLSASFDRFKEEAAKFLIHQYHNGNIWINKPMKINYLLIGHITKLPNMGERVSNATKSMELVEAFIGSKQGKNSKGILNNQA